MHDEDVLGKAYDARLMRRLLRYLRPYTAQVAVALAAIIGASVLQLAQPYLMKLAIDRYIAHRRSGRARPRSRWRSSPSCSASFALEYLQTWMLQMTGQRIMFDMRMQIYEHLQRLDLRFYDRNPVGRLMTRVTTDVDVLNDLFTAGVVVDLRRRLHAARHHDRAGRDGLAAGAGRVLGAAADRRSSRSGSAATCASRTAPCAPGSRASTRSCRSTSPACRRCSCSAASARSFERFDDDQPRAPRRQRRVDLLLRRVLSGDRGHRRARRGADHLVRRRLDDAGHADARVARRVPAVLAAVLPADQRHVGEVQRPAGGDGLVRAHLQAARHAGHDRVGLGTRDRGRARIDGPRRDVRARARAGRSRARVPSPSGEPVPGHIVVRPRLVRV